MRINVIALFTSILVLTLAAAAPAQADPPYITYKLKMMTFEMNNDPLPILSWSITGRKSSHIVVPIWDDKTAKHWLFQHDLNHRGKTDRLSLVIPITDVELFDADSALIELEEGQISAAAFGDTIIFVLAQHRYPDWGILEVEYLGFDSKGETPIARTPLLHLEAPFNQSIPLFKVAAGAGPDTIAVVFCANYAENISNSTVYVSSRIYFAEIDLSGNRIWPIEQLDLPNDGNLRISIASNPVHNGNGWVIPLIINRLKWATNPNGQQVSQIAGNDLYVAAITGAPDKRKTRLRKVAFNNDNTQFAYAEAHLLPHTGTAAAGNAVGKPAQNSGSLILFFSEKNFIPLEQRTLENFTKDYYAATIDKRGKKSGPTVIVDVPEWDHNLIYGPNKKSVRFHNDYISKPLLGEDGEYYFAQARTVRLREGQSLYQQEHECAIYSFNPVSGEVMTVARGTNNWGGSFRQPLLRWFNGKLAAINTFDTTSKEYRFYFSKVKP
ncbi:MAG TPA: hypothetical protein VMX35_04470 [Acidobacteriota bacterium]|nr:hypothetical protein [Acidobacteriota bacterium]